MESFGPFSSHRAVSSWREQQYLDGLRNGTYVPFVLPLFWVGTALLALHMLLPVKQRRPARLATFALSAAFHGWLIFCCRASDPSSSLTVGILSAWNILWAAVILIFSDAKRDYKRVKREPASKTHGPGHTISNGLEKSNGHAKVNGDAGRIQHAVVPYSWQSFPLDSFADRLGWTMDLLTSFRGIGWNWKVSGFPARPPIVEASLENIDFAQAKAVDKPFSTSGRSRFESAGAVIRHNLWLIVKGYLLLDMLKIVIIHDPYFWGLTSHAAPTYLPLVIRASAALTRVYRIVVVVSFVFVTLDTVFAVGPLLYVGLFGSGLLGSNGEAWMYPHQYGSYASVFNRGLAGFWGGWWHQLFRHGFQAGGRWFTRHILGLPDKSPLSAVVQLCTSFHLSGFLHAAASISMIGPTHPWRHMFLFFALQPVGIIAGIVWPHLLKQVGVSRYIPRWLGWLANFTWVHAWLYLTGPLLTDDLVHGGLLLFEPLPFSPLRGLGFGVAGDSFFCWKSFENAWHQDMLWWKSGIAL